jgi:hypothetical protein
MTRLGISFSSPEERNIIVSEAETLLNDLDRDEKEKARKADFYVKVKIICLRLVNDICKQISAGLVPTTYYPIMVE